LSVMFSHIGVDITYICIIIRATKKKYNKIRHYSELRLFA